MASLTPIAQVAEYPLTFAYLILRHNIARIRKGEYLLPFAMSFSPAILYKVAGHFAILAENGDCAPRHI